MIKENKKTKKLPFLEAAVVIVIICVLVSFAVPRIRNIVERSRVNEAIMFLEKVKVSQKKYHTQEDKYSDSFNALGIKKDALKYYITGIIQAGSTGSIEDSWFLMLTRKSTGSDAYTIVFTEEGFDRRNSTIINLPDINPMTESLY